MKAVLAILTALFVIITPARARDAVDSAKALEKAVHMAGSGETIRVASGRYDLADLKIPRD